MQLSSTLSWLVDAAAETAGANRLLADLGSHLITDGLPLAGGALTLEVPHPLIARRTWLWRAGNGEVIEALGFAPEQPFAMPAMIGSGDAGRRWLNSLAPGPIHEDTIGTRPNGPTLGWIGTRAFTPAARHRTALRGLHPAGGNALISAYIGTIPCNESGPCMAPQIVSAGASAATSAITAKVGAAASDSQRATMAPRPPNRPFNQSSCVSIPVIIRSLWG